MSISKASPLIGLATGMALGLSNLFLSAGANADEIDQQNQTEVAKNFELMPIVVCNPNNYDLVSAEAAVDIFAYLESIRNKMPGFNIHQQIAKPETRENLGESYDDIVAFEMPKIYAFSFVLRTLPETSELFAAIPESTQIEILLRVIDGFAAMDEVLGPEYMEQSGLNAAIETEYQGLWDYAEHVIPFIPQDSPAGCVIREQDQPREAESIKENPEKQIVPPKVIQVLPDVPRLSV